jgi:hypothetical protein
MEELVQFFVGGEWCTARGAVHVNADSRFFAVLPRLNILGSGWILMVR